MGPGSHWHVLSGHLGGNFCSNSKSSFTTSIEVNSDKCEFGPTISDVVQTW